MHKAEMAIAQHQSRNPSELVLLLCCLVHRHWTDVCQSVSAVLYTTSVVRMCRQFSTNLLDFCCYSRDETKRFRRKSILNGGEYKNSSMELAVIWQARMQATETQELNHKNWNTVTKMQWPKCKEAEAQTTSKYFCPIYCEIYPNCLYIETYHLISHKICKNLCQIYLFWTLSKNPIFWPHLKTMYKFLKMKKQMILVQHQTNTVYMYHINFINYILHQIYTFWDIAYFVQ